MRQDARVATAECQIVHHPARERMTLFSPSSCLHVVASFLCFFFFVSFGIACFAFEALICCYGQRRPTHSDDGSVSPDQKRTAQRCVAVVSPGRFLRNVL